MLLQCWASVEDGGPTLKQHWVIASSFWAVFSICHAAEEISGACAVFSASVYECYL